MRVPISWLKDYVSIELSPKELADRLTFSGLEVEGIVTVGSSFEGIMAAEVRAQSPHPNADQLRMCQIFDGKTELTLVCGASNFNVGDKVVLAPSGSQLPNGMKIKTAKIRGQISAGMLCAEDELGLSDDHSGILILPPDTIPGTPLSKVLGPPETVLVIEVTPNRPDCLSMIGIAREISALTGAPLRVPAFTLKESDKPVDQFISVTVEDGEGCRRYTARAIEGVSIAPSPSWMQRRLNLAGVRPINAVVDVTNYVMLECGQPLHAFDHVLLGGSKIIVRRARPGEAMATLDGVPRPITPEMLMIADAHRPVAVAGVMGGAGSEIRQETSCVLLESAAFTPVDIRKTARTLGMSTESSYRFERGVDPNLAEWASRRATALIVDCSGGRVARGVVDVYPRPAAPRRLEIRHDRARDLLGIELPLPRIKAVFDALELKVIEQDSRRTAVRVPTFRFDLEREADLIEELARIEGLDKIPAPAPLSRIVPDVDDRPWQTETLCRHYLVGLGLTETMHYSFLSDKLLNLFDPSDAPLRVVLPNPISADHTTLRNSLIPQMVETLGKNRAHQLDEAALFEMGRVFTVGPDGRYREETRIVVGLMGSPGRLTATKQAAPEAEEVFQWARGLLFELCRLMRVRSLKSGGMTALDVALQPLSKPYAIPGSAFDVVIEGKACGVILMLSDALREEWRISDPVAIFEVPLSGLAAHCFKTPAMAPLSIYPSVMRDLAIVVAETVRHEDIEAVIRKAAPPELIRLHLFDIYRGKSIGEGRKNMAYSFTYQSSQKTLTDDEANALHKVIMDAVVRELQAEIRAS